MKHLTNFLLVISFFAISTALYAAGEVKLNTNLTVEADGTIVSSGDATVWNDINVYPYTTTSGSTQMPSWVVFKKNAAGNSQGAFLLNFSSSIEQEVYFQVQIPHNYKVGTALLPHVHWTTTAGTPSNNVTWELEYTIMKIGGTFGTTSTATGNTIIATITPTGTGQHLITPLTTIPGTNVEISTVLVCRLYRPVIGGFANPACLLSFDIHYESDMAGSRTETTK